MTRIQVLPLRGMSAAAFLHSRWPRLYAADPDATPYQAPGWLSGWARTLPAGSGLLVLVALAADRPDDIAALALVEQGPWLAWPLGTPHAEYVLPVGPLAADPQAASALAEALAQLPGPAVMSDLPEDSALAKALSTDPRWEAREVRECAAVALPFDPEALPPGPRGEHRKRDRRWAREPALQYHRTLAGDEDALAAAFGELARLDRRRPDAGSPLDTARWRTALRHAADAAFIATLRPAAPAVGPAAGALAAQLCLVRGGTCYSVLAAADRSSHAAGHRLIRRLAEDLARHGYTALDLGRTRPEPGQRAYKQAYRPAWSRTIHLAHRGGGRP